MQKTLVSFSFLIMLLISVSNASAGTRWELAKSENGTKVYVRDVLGQTIKSFKGVTIIESNLSTLVAILKDTKAYTRLLHDCKSASLLKEVGLNESYTYIVTNMPWPVKDRDMVVHSLLSQNKETKLVEIKMSATPQLVATKQSKVRIKKMTGRWLLKPLSKDRTQVTYEMNVDPAGSLPKWLVNSISVDIPFYTLDNFRKLSTKPQYKTSKVPNIIN